MLLAYVARLQTDLSKQHLDGPGRLLHDAAQLRPAQHVFGKPSMPHGRGTASSHCRVQGWSHARYAVHRSGMTCLAPGLPQITQHKLCYDAHHTHWIHPAVPPARHPVGAQPSSGTRLYVSQTTAPLAGATLGLVAQETTTVWAQQTHQDSWQQIARGSVGWAPGLQMATCRQVMPQRCKA